ncbi:MAG: DNA-processing protein DprA [Leadbetterella sp.]
MSEDIVYQIALSRIEGIGGVLFKQIVSHFGTAKEVLEASESKLAKVPNLGKVKILKIKENPLFLKEAEHIVNDTIKQGIQIIHFKDADYPSRLKQQYDCPPFLFMKGNGSLEHPKTVAIVGTRDATEYGKASTAEIVKGLALKNVQIISGLAYGIDVAAHKAALENNISTIAVLANSLDHVYPTAHTKYVKEIMEKGALLSEQPIGTKTIDKFFVARNRIIAGLADAVIVVESKKKGGSMVTAQHANNYNKEVFAIPGGIFQEASEGTNLLISNQSAQIYTNIEDFNAWMNWTEDTHSRPIPKPQKLDLNAFTEDEKTILQLLVQNGEMVIDELAWRAEFNPNKLASILLNLEFQDLIKQSPGKKFAIKT